jgi:uncharacterized DUF497 family protein
MDLQFEWDYNKAKKNLRDHGVTFDEARTVFEDPLSYTVSDTLHSEDEERFLIIGRSIKGRLLTVVFTERPNHLRLISARKPTKAEQKAYEQE